MGISTLAAWLSARAPALLPVGVRSYFAYHGVWAPGVRILRLWSMRAKVVMLVAVMAIPMLLIGAGRWHEQDHAVERAQMRTDALQALKAAVALGAVLDRTRSAIQEGRSPPSAPPSDPARALGDAVETARQVSPALWSVWQAGRPLVLRALEAGSLSPGGRIEAIDAARDVLDRLHDIALHASAVEQAADDEVAAGAEIALRRLPQVQAQAVALGVLARRAAAALEREPRAGEVHRITIDTAIAVDRIERLLARADDSVHLLEPSARGQAAAVIGDARRLNERVRASMLGSAAHDDARAISDLAARVAAGADALRSRAIETIAARLAQEDAAALSALRWLVGSLAAIVAVAGYLLYSFFLVMRGGLGALNQQMVRMAQGDLSSRPTPLGGDEVAQVLRSMTASLTRLSDLLASVRQGVAAVFQASRQIADGNTDLSARDRRSAEGLTHIVEGIERYTGQLRRCSERVESVVATVQALRRESAHNRKQIARLEERLATLLNNSHEIGAAVDMIDAIAFRTNILALNAQVEASKAGEAGRGFAVVAQEVRALATRSADSARRIGDVIARSGADIEDSAALAQDTGRSIRESDHHVDAIHTAMDDVASLTQHGGREATDLLTELKLLQEATAKNLELVEQLAVASDALRGQGERLSHRVGLFKLS